MIDLFDATALVDRQVATFESYEPDAPGPVKLFDYAALAPDVAAGARDAAERIKGRLRQAIVDTGRDLIAVKSRMEHGAFGAWIKAELRFTDRAAENYMGAARFLDGKPETLSFLPPTVIYKLAAPSTPEAVVKEIVAAADAGRQLDPTEIRNKLATAIANDKAAKAEAAKTAEQKKKEKRVRLSREQRQKKQEMEYDLRERRQEERKKASAEYVLPLALRISETITKKDHVLLVKHLAHRGDAETLLHLLNELLSDDDRLSEANMHFACRYSDAPKWGYHENAS